MDIRKNESEEQKAFLSEASAQAGVNSIFQYFPRLPGGGAIGLGSENCMQRALPITMSIVRQPHWLALQKCRLKETLSHCLAPFYGALKLVIASKMSPAKETLNEK